MPYNFAAESFHIKKLCSRLPSRKAQFFYTENGKKIAFEFPFGLWATYNIHLRLIGMLVGHFLLGAFVLSQFTRLTDGQTESRQQYHAYASLSHGKNIMSVVQTVCLLP